MIVTSTAVVVMCVVSRRVYEGTEVRYRNTLCRKKFLKVINNLGAGTSYMYVIANLCNVRHVIPRVECIFIALIFLLNYKYSYVCFNNPVKFI